MDCYWSEGGKAKKKKGSTFEKYFKDKEPESASYINPDNKKVAVYAGNGIDPGRAKELTDMGVMVITDESELLRILKQ